MDDILLLGFLVVAAMALGVGLTLGRKLEAYRLRHMLEREMLGREQEIRKDAAQRSRSVLKGKAAENLAPFSEEFPFEASDARFMGSPLDFVVFAGNTAGEPQEVVFIEVKSGKGSLSTKERRWRDLIKEGKVRWMEVRL